MKKQQTEQTGEVKEKITEQKNTVEQKTAAEEVVDKKKLMQQSINRACGKHRFVGMLYFIGTLILAFSSFFSLVGGAIFTESGKINVLNFWTPIREVFHLKYSFLPIGMNFFVSLLYAFTIIFCFVNAMRAIAALDGLYIKGNKKIGFNQNAIAMDKLGKIFSSTFICLAYWMYFTHMFLGTEPTALFYIVTAIFLILHFWAGGVGAGASRFTARDGIQELPHTKGRVAPFIRNAMQFILIGCLMAFMSRANIINNFLYFFNGDAWVSVFGNFKAHFGTVIAYMVNPLLQLCICHFMLVLVVHATGTTEWHREGSKAKGMKICRVFSMLILAFAVLFNVAHLYLNVAHDQTTMSLLMIFVAVIALAMFIMECCMAHLPGEKKKVEKAEKVDALEEETEEEKQEETATVCTTCQYKFVDGPMIFLQPNGQPIMLMPMLPVEEEKAETEESAQAAPEKKMATPLGTNALAQEEYKKQVKDKWLARATGNPEEQAQQEEKPMKEPSKEADNLTLGEEKKVKCPHCGNIVLAQEGAPAYLCPECGKKFSF